jgi:hypothetical protein
MTFVMATSGSAVTCSSGRRKRTNHCVKKHLFFFIATHN